MRLSLGLIRLILGQIVHIEYRWRRYTRPLHSNLLFHIRQVGCMVLYIL